MLVLAVWFTHCSSTGSRRDKFTQNRPNLRCPRNGKQTNIALFCGAVFRFHFSTTGRRQTAGKVMKVALPARIPANKAVVRLQERASMTLERRRGRR